MRAKSIIHRNTGAIVWHQTGGVRLLPQRSLALTSMSLRKKIAIGLSLILLLGLGALAVFAYAFASFANGMCGNSVLAEYPSPTGRLNAIVFERSCGATTGFSTQVSLVRFGQVLENEGGTLFAADTDRGRAPSGVGGGPEVRFRWLSASTAELRHHPNVRIFTAQKKVEGVEVVYVPILGNDR